MNRKLLFLIFLIPFSFSLYIDLNKSYTIPKIIEPNKEFTYFLYLTTLTPSYDIKIKFYPPECLKMERTEYDINTIYNLYVLPVRIKNYCKENVYWIDTKIEYYDNQGYHEIKQSIPVVITTIPNLEIVKVESKNLYTGKIANITIYLKKNNVYDLRVYINSTCVFPKESYKYIGNSKSFWFEVYVPYKTYSLCPIFLTFIYNDWQGNLYKEMKEITLKINKVLGDIEIANYTIVNNSLIIKLKNGWNTKVYNIHISLFSKDLDFEKSDVFIKELFPYEVYTVSFPFIRNKEGRFKVQLVITYTDENGNIYKKSIQIPIEVFSKPDIEVKLQKIEDNTIRLIIMNNGNSKVYSLYVELKEGNYKIIGNRVVYVGELDANDYDVAEFKIIPLNRTVKLKLEIYFKDALDKVHKINKEITIEMEVKKENRIIYYMIPILLFIIAYIIYKHKKKEEE